MGGNLVIITANNADARLVNRVLLYLRDWEASDESTWDNYKVPRTIKDLSGENNSSETSPPVQDFTGNEYEGMTLAAVESLMIEHSVLRLLVLDDEGVQTQTFILAERALNHTSDDPEYYDEYDKMRIPWDRTHNVYDELEKDVLAFYEYTDEGYEEDPEPARARGRWCGFSPACTDATPGTLAARRDAAIRELQKLDLA